MIGAIIKKISIKLFGWEWYEVLRGELLKLVLFSRTPQYSKKYKICICAIFKDEAPFLKEWIEFHQLVGIEHFWLYNNNSSDDYLAVLEPYINSNVVTLIDFPLTEEQQVKAYKHFYENFRHETQWVSFLDIDEFICPNSHLTLQEWIKPYEKYPVIQMYWKMFGTSGFLKHDYNKLVTEQYVVSWKELYHCGKCIVNTDYEIVNYRNAIHCPDVIYTYRNRRIRVNPINIFHRASFSQKWFIKVDESNPSIQINHYWSKAFDQYDKKRNKTDCYYKENPKKDIKMFLWHENQNCTADYKIFRYMIQLKFRMNKMSWRQNYLKSYD